MNPNDQVARIAAAAMGEQAPGQDPAAAAQAAQAAQPPKPAPTSENNPPTVEEQAATAGAAEGEGDKMDAAAFIEIAMDPEGNQKRRLTEQQIRATYERYGQLNHKHSEMKPVVTLAEQLMKQTGAKPEQVAAYMVEAMRRASTSNTQMGGDGKQTDRPGADTAAPQPTKEGEDPLAIWERDHDVALPPGYREQMQGMEGLKQQINQLGQMLQGVLQVARGSSKDADAAQAEAATQASERIRHTIAQNLDTAAAQNGLGEADLEDFQVYMAERGYGLEDFADPDLSQKVVKDFAAMKAQPEFERMRNIHSRRQGFTGTLGATPGGSSPTAPKAPGDEQFGRLIDKAMQV